jgi:hypothetical protein
MTMLRRAAKAIVFGPGVILTWPATVAHEVTHLAVGWRWIDEVEQWSLQKTYCDVTFEPIPRWGAWLTALAPTILGLLMAVLALVSLWGSGYSSAQRDWMQWVIILAFWLQYTWPSGADRSAFGLLEGGSGDATPGGEGT